LHGEVADLFGFPGADVADFTVGIVVPALARDGIGDGFAKFVGRGGGEGGESRESALTTGAAGEWHDGIEDIVGSGIVIAAEILAGGGTALADRCAGREIQEIESVGGGSGKDAGVDLGLEHLLDGGVVDGIARFGRAEVEGADTLAMANGFARDAVFGELIDEGAGENEIEKGDELLREGNVGGGLPGGAPEDTEDFDTDKKRSIAIGEIRSGSGSVADMRVERNDADGVLRLDGGSGGFPARGARGHSGLLNGLPVEGWRRRRP
jgi:hypothetical protein